MPEAHETFQLIADRGDSGIRLDRVLMRHLNAISRISRTVAQQWIDNGAVTIDGRTARRPSIRVPQGARVRVQIPAARLRVRPAAEPRTLSILYEDDVLMVVNKPAGMVVHPSYKQSSGTLLNAVLWHLRSRGDIRPGIVTRLDKDTSGLVLISLTPAAHAALQQTKHTRTSKEYLAIARGWPTPATGSIRHPLGHDPHDRRRIVVMPGGLESETRYQVMSRYERLGARESLIRCELVTGRTHQIRVHLSAEGWPIVGDRTYGQADSAIARQALHAWRLSFNHPAQDRRVEVEAPRPEDMHLLVR